MSLLPPPRPQPIWASRPAYIPRNNTFTTNQKEETNMSYSNISNNIREAAISYLQGENWEPDAINEFIEAINNDTGTDWNPVTVVGTLHITFAVTVEVEGVKLDDDGQIDVSDLDLDQFDIALDAGRVAAAEYDSVEVV